MFCTLNLYLHIEFTCKLEVVPITIQEIHMIDGLIVIDHDGGVTFTFSLARDVK